MDSSSLPLRRLPEPDDDDLEEGHFAPADYESSNTDDDDGRYPLHRSRLEDEVRAPQPHHSRPRHLSMEDVLALGRGAALPSPTPSCESDGTISDDDANPSPASVFRAAPKRVVALDGSWAATGKRGWAGGVKPAAAAPAPLISQSSSHSNVSADTPSAQVVVVHQPSAPPPFAEQAQLVHQPPAPTSILLQLAQVAQQQPAVPPPAAKVPQVLPQRAADHPRREYTCKECGKSFPTNQALGGHAAGHRNRQREAEAAAAGMGLEDGAALRRGRGTEAPHECRKCHKVFATGVALGGHMRVHYTGPPIVPARKSRKTRLAQAAEDDIAARPPPGLSLTLSIKTEEAPSPAPVGGVRVVRLFGIDISPQVQAPSEQQCSGTTEESSSAGGQQ